MRDYRHKGKRIDNGEWVFGCFSQSMLKCYIQYHENGTSYCYQVIPETVGQFINLTIGDIEFYEDDICKDEQGNIFIIKHFTFSFEAWYPKTDDIKSLLGLWNIKKVGNIHDGPGIMEGME
jgi:hypothetical protein